MVKTVLDKKCMLLYALFGCTVFTAPKNSPIAKNNHIHLFALSQGKDFGYCVFMTLKRLPLYCYIISSFELLVYVILCLREASWNMWTATAQYRKQYCWTVPDWYLWSLKMIKVQTNRHKCLILNSWTGPFKTVGLAPLKSLFPKIIKTSEILF